MHATLEKFGYPDRVILETSHWVVMLRPVQVTLGSLVLINTSEATAFSALSPEAFADLRDVCGKMESALRGAFAYDKLNYLMLMMVDPQVHYHVLPRYSESRNFGGREFTDGAWPGPPDLSRTVATDDALADDIAAEIRRNLP